MNKENLNNKMWYRVTKVFFILSFLLAQSFSFLITYSVVESKIIYTLPIKGAECIVIYNNGTNYADGTKIKFSGMPTADDIKEVALKHNLPTTGEKIIDKERIVADIKAMEKQGASQWEVQEFLDSLSKPTEVVGFWANKTDTYTKNNYSLSMKIIYLVLSFVVVSIVFWIITRIFFYIVLGEKFFGTKNT